MKRCIIQTIGNTIPETITPESFGLCKGLPCFAALMLDHYAPFFIIQAHISTIFSCSTLL